MSMLCKAERERDEARASADRWRTGEFEKLDRFDDIDRERIEALEKLRDARDSASDLMERLS